jgi:hypothetical protein
MKKFLSIVGKTFLAVTSLVAVVGPASLNGAAEEQIPNSIKSLR